MDAEKNTGMTDNNTRIKSNRLIRFLKKRHLSTFNLTIISSKKVNVRIKSGMTKYLCNTRLLNDNKNVIKQFINTSITIL